MLHLQSITCTLHESSQLVLWGMWPAACKMSPATCGKWKVFSDHRLFFPPFLVQIQLIAEITCSTDLMLTVKHRRPTTSHASFYYLAKWEKQTLVLLNLNCLCNNRQTNDTVIISASTKKLLSQSRCLKSVKLRRRSQLLQGRVSTHITIIHQKTAISDQ